MSLTKVSSAVLNIDDLYGFRNRIINGDMRIAQRGTAAVTTAGSFPVDRIRMENSSDGAFSAQQDSSAPAGFNNSVKVTITTADTSLTTTQAILVRHLMEGVNTADLAWGTANAKTVTLSFWARSSLTGSFGGSIRNGGSRSYPFVYSISAVDTWEYKTITIPGDITGTWATNNTAGIQIVFCMGSGPTRIGTAGAWADGDFVLPSGAVSVLGTLNATWFITGIQFEVGTVATPFERRPFGMELALCQRYYYQFSNSGLSDRAYAYSPYSPASYTSLPNTSASVPMYFPVTMRAAPTVVGTPSLGSLNRQTSTTGLVVFQWADPTLSGNVYEVTSYTASAEL
jgi:hypothetical protein